MTNRLYYGDNLEGAAVTPLIETEFGRFPAMQVVTIAELIHGPRPKLPPLIKGSQGELQ